MSDPLIPKKKKVVDGEIIQLDERDDTQWVMGIAMCENCRNVWLSQCHVKADRARIHCESCHAYNTYFIPQEMIKDLFDVEVV